MIFRRIGGSWNFVELRRSDIAALLDVIEDKHAQETRDAVPASTATHR